MTFDPQRVHAEVVPPGDLFAVVDLGSLLALVVIADHFPFLRPKGALKTLVQAVESNFVHIGFP
jgi:hypothetical protein